MKLITIVTSLALMFCSTINIADYQLPPQEYATEPTTFETDETEAFDEEVIVNDAEEFTEEYVYCSVDLSNLSLGTIVSYTEVSFNGENCAEIMVNLLEDEGYLPIYSGTTDEGFYLSTIGGIDTSQIFISDYTKEFLTENDVEYTNTVFTEGELSEFDLTDFSGWMYTVNGEIPSVGMCDYIPQPGDEIVLHFTLYYGEDL